MERFFLLKTRLKKINSAPMLGRINGCGFTLYGCLKDELLDPHIIKMHWITILWIPLIPLGVYVVDRGDYDQYRIYRRMSLWRFHRIYWGRLTRFYLTVVGESLLWLVGIIAILAFVAFVATATKYGINGIFK